MQECGECEGCIDTIVGDRAINEIVVMSEVAIVAIGVDEIYPFLGRIIEPQTMSSTNGIKVHFIDVDVATSWFLLVFLAASYPVCGLLKAGSGVESATIIEGSI